MYFRTIDKPGGRPRGFCPVKNINQVMAGFTLLLAINPLHQFIHRRLRPQESKAPFNTEQVAPNVTFIDLDNVG